MRTVQLLAVSAVLASSAPALANFIPEMTFEQKLSQADVAVVAKAEALHGKQGENGSSATLLVLRTLKGNPSAKIEVWTFSDIAELNPRCCEVGATYMMFLERTPKGPFASVQGYYGIVRIGAPRTRLNEALSHR